MKTHEISQEEKEAIRTLMSNLRHLIGSIEKQIENLQKDVETARQGLDYFESLLEE